MSNPDSLNDRRQIDRKLLIIAIGALLLLLIVFAYLIHTILPQKSPVAIPATTAPSFSLQDLTLGDSDRMFPAAAASDLHGNVWLGTEGNGIWRFDPAAPSGKQWTQFTTENGLGDNDIRALACDPKGRVWAGHLNHGVSVFNGEHWQNYDVVGGVDATHPNGSLSGPLSDHVAAIEVCPTDGDVWIATGAGLARYSQANDNWSYVTRAQGLPADQANAIAFDSSGNIYLATQCDGVAMADARDGYQAWRHVQAPDKVSTDPQGTGLPTNLINDVIVAHDGTVYLATSAGLAWSTDRGKTWRYLRGQDWAEKVQNSAAGPPPDFTAVHENLLAEDYTTRLAEDSDGTMFLGYRQKGWSSFTRSADGISPVLVDGQTGFVKCILCEPSGCLAGIFAQGLVSISDHASDSKPVAQPIAIKTPAPFPAAARGDDLAAFNRLLAELALVPPMKSGPPLVVALNDDFHTQGEWLGRYGRYSAIICAIDSPKDYVWGAGPTPIKYASRIGGHHADGDGLRYYISSLYSSEPRTLEIPPVYMHSRVLKNLTTWDKNRRQAEWNDNGYSHDMNYEGPDMYCSVAVPSGLFILSLYELSDGGQEEINQHRDYELVVKAPAAAAVQIYDNSGFDSAPTLAHTRVSDFAGGVYKRFLVQGPSTLTVKVCKNYSNIAKLSGVMLDLPDEHPVPYFLSVDEWAGQQMQKEKVQEKLLADWTAGPAARAHRFGQAQTESEAAAMLVDLLQELRDWNPQWWAQNARQLNVRLARWYQAQSVAAPLTTEAIKHQATCLYESGLYPAWEAAQTASGQRTARSIEKSLRWDRSIPAYSGRGFQTVTQFLALPPSEQIPPSEDVPPPPPP